RGRVGGPPLGQEAPRLSVVANIAVQQIRAHQHEGAGPQVRAVYEVILDDAPANRPRWRIKPHGFSDHHPGIFEPRQVLHCWWPAFQDVVELSLEPLGYFGFTCERIERPEESADRARVAGCVVGDDFVADLSTA